jgi:uncharacterized protein YjbJ (UPF0337 family)
MNEEQVKENWKKLSGKFKEKWGKLTDDDLMRAKGRSRFLIGKIQERYGQTKESAIKEVNEFFESIQ